MKFLWWFLAAAALVAPVFLARGGAADIPACVRTFVNPNAGTTSPTRAPSRSPSAVPTRKPTNAPTPPTIPPSRSPTVPTASPTSSPSLSPTFAPTQTPKIIVEAVSSNGSIDFSECYSTIASEYACEGGAYPLLTVTANDVVSAWNDYNALAVYNGTTLTLIADNVSQLTAGNTYADLPKRWFGNGVDDCVNWTSDSSLDYGFEFEQSAGLFANSSISDSCDAQSVYLCVCFGGIFPPAPTSNPTLAPSVQKTILFPSTSSDTGSSLDRALTTTNCKASVSYTVLGCLDAFALIDIEGDLSALTAGVPGQVWSSSSYIFDGSLDSFLASYYVTNAPGNVAASVFGDFNQAFWYSIAPSTCTALHAYDPTSPQDCTTVSLPHMCVCVGGTPILPPTSSPTSLPTGAPTLSASQAIVYSDNALYPFEAVGNASLCGSLATRPNGCTVFSTLRAPFSLPGLNPAIPFVSYLANVTIATSTNDLFDGIVANNLFSAGVLNDLNATWWNGLTPSGASSPHTCDGWTNPLATTWIGSSNSNQMEWINYQLVTCSDANHRIVCVCI